jgi:hypothetical protein
VSASQAFSHLTGSFSAYVHYQVSALANRAVIIEAFCAPFLDLFRTILDIIIVSIVIEKETLSAHFAAIFIACSTILPEFILAISAFNFGKILWVKLFDELICVTIKVVTLHERNPAYILCCTWLEHR